MKCKDAIPLMHDYLDGDLDANGRMELRVHLEQCGECSARLKSLEKAEAFVRILEPSQAPADLSAKILASLPPVRARRTWGTWVRRHPAATAAAAFLILMIGSFLSMWNQGTQLVVRGDDLDGVVIEGRKVIIPEGSTMEGNLIVENGTLEVNGDVKGNLTVVDGKVALASTAHISGQINQVDQALDWIWFKIGDWFSLLTGKPQPSM